MLETLHRKWVKQLLGENATNLVMDTQPIPVMGYRTSERSIDFHSNADYSDCAPKKIYKYIMCN